MDPRSATHPPGLESDGRGALARYTAVDWTLGIVCLVLCALAVVAIRGANPSPPGTPGADGHVVLGAGLFGTWFLLLGWWPGPRVTTSMAKVLAFAFAWFVVLALLGSIDFATWRLALLDAPDVLLASWLVAFLASLPAGATALLLSLRRLE